MNELSVNYSPAGILKFGTRRSIVNLFKSFLEIVEEIEKQHSESMGRLYDALPPEHQTKLQLANHLTEEKMVRIRKEILSKGNDCWRNIDENINNFNITLKE